MNNLIFFLVALALGSANPIDPTTTTAEPSREDRIRTAIANNVQWLLSSIRNGSFEGPELARAVVALYLGEPGYFSAGHEIGQKLKISVNESLFSHLSRLPELPLNMPVEELASYVQALTVSCQKPTEFFGYDLVNDLWESGMRSQRNGGRFPASAFLALCNADATYVLAYIPYKTPVFLSDEEAVTMMAIDCFESHFPWNLPAVQSFKPIRKSGYQHYPSNLTVENLQEWLNPSDGNPKPSLAATAAAMQTLMYIHRLQVSDLPSTSVDLLLTSQDEDGSWGQSVLNSYFILPVLSNKNFRDIGGGHCPSTRRSDVPGNINIFRDLSLPDGDY